MKMKLFSILITLLTLLMLRCTETPPKIIYTPSFAVLDTAFITSNIPAAEIKNILIEDFTGVGCVNCPTAHDVLKAIKLNYPNRVYSMACHPLNAALKTLTEPIKFPPYVSKQDFRTDDANTLFLYLGGTNSLPTGSINRKLFQGEAKIVVANGLWPGYAKNEIEAQLKSVVNIDTLNIKYETSTKEIIIDSRLVFTQSLSDSQYLTVAILENNIIDVQEKTDNGNTIYIADYQHDNVLRKILTNPVGDLLKAKLDAGRVFRKRFIYKPTDEELKSWNTDNLAVIAFVHGNATKKDVIQVKAASIKP